LNEHNLKYNKFIAAEQEFNTNTYGIKGSIDATIFVTDPSNQTRATALEIKTGKYTENSYHSYRG